jgi:hypothetical protein
MDTIILLSPNNAKKILALFFFDDHRLRNQSLPLDPGFEMNEGGHITHIPSSPTRPSLNFIPTSHCSFQIILCPRRVFSFLSIQTEHST